MKDELRRRFRRERDNFKGGERESADAKIFGNFFGAFGNFDSYFVYNSFKSEADTSRIISELLRRGKRVYLPRVEGEKIVPVPYGETVRGAFGIAEPEGQAFAGDIDVTVVPLLALNARGCRVGYGGGFYDKYLKGAKTLSVGLAYGFQMTDFKEDCWDEPLGFAVTESGVVKFNENNKR